MWLLMGVHALGPYSARIVDLQSLHHDASVKPKVPAFYKYD